MHPTTTPVTTPDLVPDWLARQATLNGYAPALIEADRVTTWSDLDRAANGLADELRRLGIRAGDRVALLAGNSTGFASAVHGVKRAGAELVPLNTRLTGPEIAHQLIVSEARLVVADAPLAPVVRGAHTTEVVLLDQLLEQDHRGTAAPALTDLAKVQSVVFSSGTTGVPKGAQLTFGNWWWGAVGSSVQLGHLPSDRWLAVLPLFHVGGLAILFRSAITGVPVVVHDRFDPERVGDALDRGVTLASLVPTMLQRLLDSRHGRKFPPSVRAVLLGGAPTPVELIEQARAIGLPVAPTYGLTEAASQVATLRPDLVPAHLGTSGQPLPVTSVRIERHGAELPSGEIGEIAVRGRTLMRGYLGDDPGLESDGWFRTGDVGTVDRDGFLTVLDRRDDLIISGGENIYPAEVEAALTSHPDVIEAAVVGREDPAWGASPVAFVVLRDAAAAQADAIANHARARLAGYKVPREIRFVDALPRTASGKLQRGKVRGMIGDTQPGP